MVPPGPILPAVGVWDWLFGTIDRLEVAGELHPPYPSVQAQIDAYVAARTGRRALDPPGRRARRPAPRVGRRPARPGRLRRRRPARAPAVDRRPARIPGRPATRSSSKRSARWSRRATRSGSCSITTPTRRAVDGPAARASSRRIEVDVDGTTSRFLPVYSWRGRRMTPGVDLVHIPLAPRVGELRGRSPLVECATALLTIQAQELYAAGWFGGSGVPSATLTSPVELDDLEADALKAAWLEAHSGPVPTPAVLSGGITWEAEAVDPERSQLTARREHGVATVARLLGIPAPLLLVAISSARSPTRTSRSCTPSCTARPSSRSTSRRSRRPGRDLVTRTTIRPVRPGGAEPAGRRGPLSNVRSRRRPGRPRRRRHRPSRRAAADRGPQRWRRRRRPSVDAARPEVPAA